MLFNGMDKKNGGEINGSERAEEVRVQEACTGSISHISIRRIPEEEVIWYKDHSLIYVHGRETSCPFRVKVKPRVSYLKWCNSFLNGWNVLEDVSMEKRIIWMIMLTSGKF